VSKLYGEHLMEKQHYQEAGLIFSRAGHLELALSAFESSLDWKQAIITATRLDVGCQKMQQLACRLASMIAFDYL
jgi:hypothetical protein